MTRWIFAETWEAQINDKISNLIVRFSSFILYNSTRQHKIIRIFKWTIDLLSKASLSTLMLILTVFPCFTFSLQIHADNNNCMKDYLLPRIRNLSCFINTRVECCNTRMHVQVFIGDGAWNAGLNFHVCSSIFCSIEVCMCNDIFSLNGHIE